MTPDDYPAIGDYAVIGDCRSAALVSRRAAIEWLCLPRFDSPSLFAAVLDRLHGGRLEVNVPGAAEASRRYVDGTNVLVTTLAAPTGRVRVTDAMSVGSDGSARLQPGHEVIRRIELLHGEADVEVVVDPRPDYGRVIPTFRRGPAGSFLCQHGPGVISVRSGVPLDAGRGLGLRGTARLRAGERRHVSLGYEHGLPSVLPALGDAADRAIDSTARWWREWSAAFSYDGPYREPVLRSALALKLLTFAPSGAIAAAVTTSLPEAPGGARNWDYRYCWLRDGSMTLRALFDLGFHAEAEAFLSWMLHATRLTWPALQVMYDVYGRTRLPERELPHLEGYRGSRPVRIGNGAATQLQLDVYGEVIEAAARYVARGGRLDRAGARMLAGLGRTVARSWPAPDDGIWEARGGPRHHTLSKVMCGVALDRLVALAQQGHVDVPVARFARERDAIRAEVEARGFSTRLGSYVSVLDGEAVDASLLLLALHGYAAPTSPRMRGTCALVRERLGVNGLLYRYLEEDGIQGKEGAFGICGFWDVECLAREGQVERAAESFERLLGFANDVGLFAEEVDPSTGASLGNTPQAFTHIGLINAALAIQACEGERERA